MKSNKTVGREGVCKTDASSMKMREEDSSQKKRKRGGTKYTEGPKNPSESRIRILKNDEMNEKLLRVFAIHLLSDSHRCLFLSISDSLAKLSGTSWGCHLDVFPSPAPMVAGRQSPHYFGDPTYSAFRQIRTRFQHLLSTLWRCPKLELKPVLSYDVAGGLTAPHTWNKRADRTATPPVGRSRLIRSHFFN